MATAESVKAQLTALLTQANDTTGKTDANLTASIASLIAGFGKESGGGQIERGNFVVDLTNNINIPCEFEPDVIVISREQEINQAGDVKCITQIRVIKNWLTTGRYVAADGSTTEVDGSRDWKPSGYGTIGLSYTDGAISGCPSLNGRNLIAGYTYQYIFGRFGL